MYGYPLKYYPQYAMRSNPMSYPSDRPDSQYGFGPSMMTSFQHPAPAPTQPVYPTAMPLFRTTLPPPTTTITTVEHVPHEAPTTTTTAKPGGTYIINKRYKYIGYALILLSLAILGLEVANVIFTAFTFDVTAQTFIKKSFTAPYILTWIAPGVWGAIPLFITGYLAIRVAGKFNKLVRVFALFCALSAFVFTPAILAVNITEIIMYPKQPEGDTPPMFNNKMCYDLSDSGTLSCPKFILPLVVAVLSGIAFYITIMITMIFCCCWNQTSGTLNKSGVAIVAAQAPTTPTVAAVEVKPEPRTTHIIDEQYPYFQPSPYPGAAGGLGGMYGRGPQMIPSLPATTTSEQPYYGQGNFVPDMNLLSGYPAANYRPATSRGFGFASAYRPQSGYEGGNFVGSLPSLGGLGSQGPNPAYRVVYG